MQASLARLHALTGGRGKWWMMARHAVQAAVALMFFGSAMAGLAQDHAQAVLEGPTAYYEDYPEW